jgi:hypothetical protein
MKDAMALTGHRSVQTFLKYFQTGAIQHSRAADLLRTTEPSARAPDPEPRDGL